MPVTCGATCSTTAVCALAQRARLGSLVCQPPEADQLVQRGVALRQPLAEPTLQVTRPVWQLERAPVLAACGRT